MILFWLFLGWMLLIPVAGVYGATLICLLIVGALLLRNRINEWQYENCVDLKRICLGLFGWLIAGLAAIICIGLVAAGIWSLGGPLLLAATMIVPFLWFRYSRFGRKLVRVIGRGF